MNSLNINTMIERLELTNCKSGDGSHNAERMNEILIELGGKPVCVDQEYQKGGGSNLDLVNTYMSLLLARKIEGLK